VTQSKAVRRGWTGAGSVLVAAVLAAVTSAAFAFGLERLALWRVVQVCVANSKLTGTPFPCLKVDLSGGEERGDVVLRAPVFNDLILAPTRKIVGVEDPFLQSPDAPNYFDAAWRSRSFLEVAGRGAPERDQVGLVVNSAVTRSQDQLHIHVGCVRPAARRALAAAAPAMPLGQWAPVGAVIPHSAFWGMRVRGTDLAGVEPFRLAAAALGDGVRNRAVLTIMVAGARVEGDDEFLILASYAGAPHAWRPVGADDLLDPACSAETNRSEGTRRPR